jgi:cupin fold WbuC family metalloprotein
LAQPEVRYLSQSLINQIAQQAVESPRQRQNYNFHDLSETVQRFLNVMQPGTYVRPHRHCPVPDMHRFEFFLVLQGRLGILILDATGTVLQQGILEAQGELRGIEVPPGTYHTLIALAPDTVMFEVKQGPYSAATDKEFLPLFPEEGTAEAQEQVAAWQQLFA